jgi:hypothetical protein
LCAGDSVFPVVYRRRFFAFIKLIFREVSSVSQKLRNIDYWVGFHFAAAIASNAQDQLYHHLRTKDDDFRDGGEP